MNYYRDPKFHGTFEDYHIERLFVLLEINAAYIKSLTLRRAKFPLRLSCLLNKLPNLTSIYLNSVSVIEETAEVNTVLNLRKLRSLRIYSNNSRIYDVFNYLPSDVLRKLTLQIEDPIEDQIYIQNSFWHKQVNLEVMAVQLPRTLNEVDSKICPLSRFQELRTLKIYKVGGNNALPCFNTIFLPNLTTLTLEGCIDLNSLPISTMKALQQGLPKLELFVLLCCPNNFVNTILEQFQMLKSLQILL